MSLKGKTIRDAIHGDIFIPKSFLDVIDTPEFQRLKRIRQLSTAYSVYPCAEHTRFSHSIGTYYVMELIINHFSPIFVSIGHELQERQIQLALAVALLHDIGHGPFSHAFENALPNSEKMHEQWTIEIVSSEESNIFKVLSENFDNEFPYEVANLIQKDKDVKKHRIEKENNSLDLFFVLSSLISSQLDADRMDYLLRDSYFTGVSYGIYDLERLISSLTLTEYKNNYYVCIREKYLTVVEEYLLSRYQMHQNVYLHSFKCETELLVKKIIYRAFELYQKKLINESQLPQALKSAFAGNNMTIEEYISLDDSILINLFSIWKQADDPILSRLCLGFLNRVKYQHLDLLDNSDETIKYFKHDFTTILKQNGYEINDFNNEYFWLEEKVKNETYKDRKDNIWVLKNNGTVCDLAEISKLITDNLREERNYTFIDFEMFKQRYTLGDAGMEDLKNLLKLYNNKNHIEIEKKYCFNEPGIIEQVKDFIRTKTTYKIEESETNKQIDYYFDTQDGLLDKNNKTLRIREVNNNFLLTVKTPTKEIVEKTQNERFEYETRIETKNILETSDYFLKYLPELKNVMCEMKQNLIIENQRNKFKLTDKEIQFEMVFDNVIYRIGEKHIHEYEIEIELKSDYIHRVNLKMLSDDLEKAIPELKPIYDSKYHRGLNFLK